MSEEKINNSNEANDFELKNLYDFLLRNKKIIFGFVFFSMVLGVFNAYRSKNIWQGEFQIVIDQEERGGASLINLTNINAERFGINNKNKIKLKTELKILESPLVLSEVFKFVNEQKAKETKGQIKENSFKAWKKESLTIDLEPGTSVLNLSYRDSQRELIIPVLEKISKRYQEYSNRSRVREIDLSKTFFKEQINFYKDKSLTSLKNIEKFANDQNLLSIQVFNMGGTNEDFIKNINIEAIKIVNFNEIKKLEMQLKNLEEKKNNKDLFYFAKSFKGFSQDKEGGPNLLVRIQNLDEEISLKRFIYNEKDKYQEYIHLY